jgi:ankyrin repeat protein
MDRFPPIFLVSRVSSSAIPAEEDRALRRLADAVGLTARDPILGTTVLHTAALTARELCTAAEHGDLAAVTACLAAGLSVDSKDPLSQKSALFWAARSREASALQVIDRLLADGANPNADPRHGALEEALGQRRDAALSIPRLQRLIAAGARADDETVVEWLSDPSYPAESRRALVAALRSAGAFSAAIPLAAAVTMRDVDAVRAALAAGADPADEEHGPLLHLAAADGISQDRVGDRVVTTVTAPASLPIVELLLKAGADPGARASRNDNFQVEGFEHIAGDRAEKAMQAALAIRDARSDERAKIVTAILEERARRNGGAAPEEDDDESSEDDDEFDDE